MPSCDPRTFTCAVRPAKAEYGSPLRRALDRSRHSYGAVGIGTRSGWDSNGEHAIGGDCGILIGVRIETGHLAETAGLEYRLSKFRVLAAPPGKGGCRPRILVPCRKGNHLHGA